jgi:hypothetical protein
MLSVPHAFDADGFVPRQSLFVTFEDDVDPDQVEADGAWLTGSESLVVEASMHLCAKLLSSLPPMPRLTELTANAYEKVAEISGGTRAGPLSGRPPTARSLRPAHMLDVESWDEAIRHQAH